MQFLSKFKRLLWQRPKLSIPSCGTKRGPKWLNDTEKENKSGRLVLPNLKTYCKDTIIKIEWNSHKDKHKDPWYRIESIQMNPNSYIKLIFDKGAMTIQ